MSARHKCTVFSRFALIVINTALAIFSLAIIALVLWIRLDVNFELEIRNDLMNLNENPPDFFAIKKQIRAAITVSFWVIIGFSIATLVLSLIGICAAIAQNRSVYIFYLGCVAILVLLEVAIGIFIIIYRPSMKSTLDTHIGLAFQYNTQDSKSFMQRYQCCGDSTNNPYNQQCLQLGVRLTRDCPTAVWDRLNYHLMIAGLVMIGVVVVKIFSIMFSFIVVLNHRYRTLID